MKKCASCTKDLPDAALHCVFCGAKQPPAPATTGGMAKTVMGSYSASDMMEQLKNQPGGPMSRPAPNPSPAPSYGAPASPGPPYGAGPGPGGANPYGAGPGPAPSPYQPPRPAPGPTPGPPHNPAAFGATQLPSPPQPSPYAPPPGVPAAPSSAATMFVPGSGPPPQQGNFGGSPGMRPMGQPYAPPGAGAYGAAPGPAQSPYAPQPLQPMPPPPPPMVYQPQPIQSLPQSMPYLGGQTAARAGRPIEPWKDSLRLMMFVWGGALLLAFVTPTLIDPITFNWDMIINGAGKQKLPPLIVAAVGLLSIVLALIPTSPAPRGLIAGVLGLAGILIPIFMTAIPPWQVLVPLAGGIVLIPGLLLRQEYRESVLPRILVTIGAIAVLLPILLPVNGTLPLVGLFKIAIEGGAEEKILALLKIANIVLLVLTLLAWLPAPASGGAKVFAWALLLWPALTLLTTLVLAGVIADAISQAPYTILAWVPGVSYGVLVGYGFATVVGKKLE